MAFVTDTVIVKAFADGTAIHRSIFTSVDVPVAEVFTPTGPCEVLEIRIHLSVAGDANDLTITIDSASGAAYDTTVQLVTMATVTDIHRTGDDDKFILAVGDALKIDWANAGQPASTVSIEIIWRSL